MHTLKLDTYLFLSRWGLFCILGRSSLVRFHETFNNSKYIEISKHYILPFKQHHLGTMDFIDKHDGCGPHRVKSVAAFLDAEKVDLLPWPFQSPDQNPIEKVWSTM